MMPKVTVIMNCHNSGKYLAEAIESVLQQTFTDYEIVFWDNQSTDNSTEVALSYGDRVRYFRGEEFLPLAAARNAAIQQAKGKYIALLDCDDLWLPEKLEKQIALFESDPSVGLVFSDTYFVSANGDIKFSFFKRFKPYSGNVFFNLIAENFISCETAVFTREAFEKVGGFRPELKTAEEYDIFLRMAYHYKLAYVPAPLAKYRVHETNYTRINWAESLWETADIIEKMIDMVESFSKAQARVIRNKTIRTFVGFTLAYLRRGRLLKALGLLFVLTRRYILISAKLRRKTV